MENKNEMMVFNNVEFGSVRVVNIDGEAWLAGKDVVEALGYNLSGKHVASEYIKAHCEPEDYVLLDKNSPVNWGAVFDYKQLGQRGGYLINESGMYSLAFGTDLPEAKKFKRWVTSEVLPQIRMTGVYIPVTEEDTDETIMAKGLLGTQKTIDNKQQIIDKRQQLINKQQGLINKQQQMIDKQQGLINEQRELIDDQQEMINDQNELIDEQQEMIDEQEVVINNQQEVIESQRDKVEFADAVSESEDDDIDMGTMAKLLANKGFKIDGKNIGRNTLFEFLRNSNILMNDNLPYQTYINRGYFIVVEYTMYNKREPKLCRQTLVTGKGQLYITKKVKEYCENKNNENNK